MVEAERGLKPVGLAGIPYDDSYAMAAADLPAADAVPTDETDQAAGAGAPRPRRATRT